MTKFIVLYSFIITSILIISLSFIAKKIKFFDVANSRKIHHGEIPLIGGTAVLFNLYFFSIFFDFSYQLQLITFSSIILFTISLLDDFIEVRPIYRLLFQVISSLIVVGGGIILNNLGQYSFTSNLELGAFSILFTIFSITFFINANNFIDGIDGLCASYLIISFISLLFYSSNELDQNLINFFVIIISSLLCFLIFNINLVPNNKIFLGDSGSITIGFILSWVIILFAENNIIAHPVLAIWIVGYPIFDLISVVLIRISNKDNPLHPDKKHLHHLLLTLSLNKKVVLLIIVLIILFIQISGFYIYQFFGPDITIISFLIYLTIYLLISRNLYNKLQIS